MMTLDEACFAVIGMWDLMDIAWVPCGSVGHVRVFIR